MDTLFQWQALTPELGTAGLAVLILALELLLPANLKYILPRVALWGLTALAAGILPATILSAIGTSDAAGIPRTLFSGMISQTPPGGRSALPTDWLRLFFLVAAFLTVALGTGWLRRNKQPVAEFLFLVLTTTAALMLLVQSNHFVMFYVTLELATTGTCILTAFKRESGASLEAGMKYLLLSVVSGALLLFGIVLLYGAAGNPALNNGVPPGDVLGFGALFDFNAAHPAHPFVLAGTALVTGGIAFKIGIFPFQIWVPDVYQGAPTPVTAFLATASKTAGIFALLLLMNGPFAPLVVTDAATPGPLFRLVALMAGATLVFSNLTALGQTDVKRLMGLSGLSHTGFMLLAVLAAQCGDGEFGNYALLFYAVAYLIGTFSVFGVMGEISAATTGNNENSDSEQSMTDYRLLRARHPLLCAVLCSGLSSLAGIPPTLGFVAKFAIIAAAMQAGLWTLSGVALLCVCAGVYYYFAWIRESFQHIWVPEERLREMAAPIAAPLTTRLLLAALATVLLLGGVAQGLTRLF